MKNNNENILIKKLAKDFEFDVCRVTDPKLELSTELRLKEFSPNSKAELYTERCRKFYVYF